MRNFKKLEVWREARLLAKNIYLLTDRFPSHEMYGLTSQIRRCSVSIAANIAEGAAKHSTKDFTRFLEISLGSCFELESHLLLACDLGFADEATVNNQMRTINTLQKRLHKFISYNRSETTPET